jgi:putative sterol carrier protein
MEPSTDEILFAAMQEAVSATPSLKSKFNACVEFHLEGKSLTLDVAKSKKTKPDLVVTMSLPTLHKILNKKLTPQQALLYEG